LLATYAETTVFVFLSLLILFVCRVAGAGAAQDGRTHSQRARAVPDQREGSTPGAG